MTVDEILATGQYTDRRGRVWKIVRSPVMGTWWGTPRPDDVILILHENKMRLLIERDQHRDVCEGLQECGYHPVPFVEIFRHLMPPYHVDYQVVDTSVEPNFNQGLYRTLPEAMDAARTLAVGE